MTVATPVTVVAHYEDSVGNPLVGQLIAFTPSANLIVNGTDGVAQQPVIVKLDSSGNLSVQLWASNDPNVQPQGFTYQVNEFPGNAWGDTFSISVVASSTPVQLKSLAPVATGASTTFSYVSTAVMNAAIAAATSGLATASAITSAVSSEATTRSTADTNLQAFNTAALMLYAGIPDSMASGTINRDSNGAATTFAVVWPDGATGTFTTTTASTAFPGAVDAYTVTHVLGGTTKTYTQSLLTRDATSGAVTARPAITVA